MLPSPRNRCVRTWFGIILMVYLANTIDEKPTAKAQRRREKRRKNKTRNPENMEETEDCGGCNDGRAFSWACEDTADSAIHPKKTSVSSVFFLRSLRVSGFLVLVLFLRC